MLDLWHVTLSRTRVTLSPVRVTVGETVRVTVGVTPRD
jgi:hypothetical protein